MSLREYYQRAAIPKPKPRKALKARKDREDAKQLETFRNLVWRREVHRSGSYCLFSAREWAHCQHCGATVTRGDDMQLTGEVHHRIFRGNKATRYDPANGVLLCNHFVNNCHEKAERKLITV